MESPLIYSNLPVSLRQEMDGTDTGQENNLETSFITDVGNGTEGMAFAFWQSGTGFTYEIPDCLMHRDFIEVHGICLGNQITFELCTKEGQAKTMPDVVPLQVILNSSGQVTVLSRNKQKVEKQELFKKNCIQPNMNFELCVYAYEDRYEVFLNKEKICAQKHLVELPEVFALSMDGDAEFMSVEFKDLYWEDDAASSKLDEDVPSGFVRVQEMRESARNKKGEQVMVPLRNSFRSSQQSKTGPKPGMTNNEVSTWRTSTDLSKPYLDKDYPAALGSPETYAPEARTNTGPQLYATLPSYTTQQSSKNDPSWAVSQATLDTPGSAGSKPRLGMAGSRKSITLGDEKPDRLSVGGDIHQGNYRPIDDQYDGTSAATLSMGPLVTASTPSLQEKNKKKRFSLLSKHRKSKGSEPDIRASVQQDVESDVKLRKSRGSAFDVRPKEDGEAKKKKRFSFKNIFKRKKSRDSVEITPSGSGIINHTIPSYQRDSYENPSPRLSNKPPLAGAEPKDLLKRPSADIAAYLHGTNNYSHLSETTLTGRSTSDAGFRLRRVSQDMGTKSPSLSRVSIGMDQAKVPQSPVGVGSPSSIKVGKLKGSAPEMASLLYAQHPDKYGQDTTLTELNARSPIERGSTSIKIDNVYSSPTILASAPTKLKGNAPEMASQILRNNPHLDDDYVYYTNLSGIGAQADKKSPTYKRNISIDRDVENPVFKPNTVTIASDKPVYVSSKDVQKTRQAVSLPDYRSDEENNLSEGSTVYSDGEYYLEVGKSAYYFERKRSLKNYRSRRSVKQDKAVRRQMGLSTGDSDSALSSISSLKPDDPKMTPQVSRRRVGAGTKEVRSWLDSQSSDYGRDDKIRPTAASTRVVYADAPPVQLDQIDKYSTKDICQTFQNKDMVELSIPLIPGREAHMFGSFINSTQNPVRTGLIKLICSKSSILSTDPSVDESHLELFMQIWSDGHLELFTQTGTDKKLIRRSPDQVDYANPRSGGLDENRFCLRLMKQCLYFAVTWNNRYTLIIPDSVLSISPHAIKVEDPNSIQLDQIVMAKCLAVPLRLVLPPNCQGLHNLELNTKLTADSEEILLKYQTKLPDQDPELSITMDLVQFKLYVTYTAGSAVRIQPADIPFVPEQIKAIKVTLFKAEQEHCSLKIELNNTELLSSMLGPVELVSHLTGVRVAGDLQLIDAQLKPIQ